MDGSSLLILQSKIKTDHRGYQSEFIQHYQQYQSQLLLFQIQPQLDHREFGGLIKFISHVAQFYPEIIGNFPTEICELLEKNMQVLNPKFRLTVVKSLILLRNRNLLSATSLLSLFFKLFRCKDKKLRGLLHNHIVSDVKKSNMGKKDNALNNKLQSFMYTMLQDDSSVAPRESLRVMIELYRKNIWNDKKTVNAISNGIFSEDPKVIATVLNFFLSPPGFDDEDEDMIEKANKYKTDVVKKYGHNYAGKTKKRKRKLEEGIQKAKTMRKKAVDEYYDEKKSFNYAAMSYINDPQHYSKKVFGVLKKCNHGFELKVRLMAFISKLINTHELMLEKFYSFMQKYCQPHQQYVTKILAIFATSCHEMVSPDVLENPINSIANNFVSDRRTTEVIALGINTIKEICLRCPLAMNETLLKDLIQYKKSKDKGVMMAARSLLGVYRVLNPSILPKKERGKYADTNTKPLQYGEREVTRFIPGTEYLDESDESSSDQWEEVTGSEESGDVYESDADIVDTDTEDVIADQMNYSTVESASESVAGRLEGTKLLSQRQWEKLQDIQRDLVEKNPSSFGVKRRLAELYDVDLDDEIDEDDLKGPSKRQKSTKEEMVQLHKDGVVEYKPERKKGTHLSKTNTESQHKKAYSMVKHKKLKKNTRMSFRQRKSKKSQAARKTTHHRKWH